jgi:hypothetical protein
MANFFVDFQLYLNIISINGDFCQSNHEFVFFKFFYYNLSFVEILQLGFNEKILLCIQFLSNYFPKLKILLTFIIYIFFNAHF